MHPHRLARRLTGRVQEDLPPAGRRPASSAALPAPAVSAAHDSATEPALSPGQEGRTTGMCGPVGRTAVRVTTRLRAGVDEAMARPDRGDISITTVIIWVAAVTGALLIAGTIAAVIAKYNGQLNGL